MTVLPDEIWSDILDYLDPLDLVSSQRVSHRLLKLARDSSLWRNKVFERAPSATHFHGSKPSAFSDLAGALGGLSLGGASSQTTAGCTSDRNILTIGARSRVSRRAKAILEWDPSHPSEKIDWYSEYIARHAPISATWAESGASQLEIRGMALYNNAEKVIGSTEDGSLGIWDIKQLQGDRRKLVQIGKSKSGLLFEDTYSLGEPSTNTKSKSLGTSVESIHVDSGPRRAFVAVEDKLNEVDLDRMEVVSQNKFAWPITALSQEDDANHNLTVGTSFSLHIHDPRLQYIHPTDNIERLDNNEKSKIAFLQNWTKGEYGMKREYREPFEPLPEPSLRLPASYRPHRSNRMEAYARVEPGPQSILHLGKNEIVIAGRMPSILFYDRRNFPKPRTAIHSGARLSSLTTLPVPPNGADPSHGGDSTLIACGEYGGRGSVEIYELPWEHKRTSFNSIDRQSTFNEPFSFRNRQDASSSKLLSVATQGTRIVFSDSEGMLKWVERDGHGLARRWNINSYYMGERAASLLGDKVIRKILVLPEEEPSERGVQGDGDILVWTGDNIGIVTTKPKPWDDHDELVQAFERGMDLNGRERRLKEKEAEFSNMMRRALERQADERRWMSRFGARRRFL